MARTCLVRFIFFVLCVCLECVSIPEKPIVVVIPSYNNSQWYGRNLGSVLAQQYKNYRVFYIDDCSTDGTYGLVEKYLAMHDTMHRIILRRNEHNVGALHSLYHVAHATDDRTIVVVVDGDDWLAHNGVLAHINKIYSQEEVLMTYGTFMIYPTGKIDPYGVCRPYPREMPNCFRTCSWRASHLRTFYAGLFKLIKKEDLMSDGVFLPSSQDLAQMIPMLEMSGGRYRCLEDVLYVYNHANLRNHDKDSATLQRQTSLRKMIESKPSYAPLSDDVTRRFFGR